MEAVAATPYVEGLNPRSPYSMMKRVHQSEVAGLRLCPFHESGFEATSVRAGVAGRRAGLTDASGFINITHPLQ